MNTKFKIDDVVEFTSTAIDSSFKSSVLNVVAKIQYIKIQTVDKKVIYRVHGWDLDLFESQLSFHYE